MEYIYVNRWKETLNNERGVSGRGGNKLRKYRLFKSRYPIDIVQSLWLNNMSLSDLSSGPFCSRSLNYELISKTQHLKKKLVDYL